MTLCVCLCDYNTTTWLLCQSERYSLYMKHRQNLQAYYTSWIGQRSRSSAIMSPYSLLLGKRDSGSVEIRKILGERNGACWMVKSCSSQLCAQSGSIHGPRSSCQRWRLKLIPSFWQRYMLIPSPSTDSMKVAAGEPHLMTISLATMDSGGDYASNPELNARTAQL